MTTHTDLEAQEKSWKEFKAENDMNDIDSDLLCYIKPMNIAKASNYGTIFLWHNASKYTLLSRNAE